MLITLFDYLLTWIWLPCLRAYLLAMLTCLFTKLLPCFFAYSHPYLLACILSHLYASYCLSCLLIYLLSCPRDFLLIGLLSYFLTCSIDYFIHVEDRVVKRLLLSGVLIFNWKITYLLNFQQKRAYKWALVTLLLIFSHLELGSVIYKHNCILFR